MRVLGCVFGVALLLPSLALVGCAGASYKDMAGNMEAPEAQYVEGVAMAEPDGAADVPAAVVLADRKIIYTATIELNVESFDDVPEKVQAAVERHQGYISGSEIHGVPGQPRRGHWTIRVPVTQYEQFLAAARTLGEVRSVTTDSADVSEEYYDVEARIHNKKKAESRLVAHLEETTAKLEDILTVERELARVREEIERMEGRLRYLKDRTSLSTIQLHVNEVTQYSPEEAPAYSTRIGRTWQSSLDSLLHVGQTLLLVLVFAAPWLVIFLILGTVVWIILRRIWRRLQGKPVCAEVVRGKSNEP